MGKLFKQNFPYVFIQRTIFTREKASSNPVLFSQRPFLMLLFPFFPRNSCFSSGCLNSPQKNTDSHFAIRHLRTVWFLTWQLHSVDRYFQARKLASHILEEVSWREGKGHESRNKKFTFHDSRTCARNCNQNLYKKARSLTLQVIYSCWKGDIWNRNLLVLR